VVWVICRSGEKKKNRLEVGDRDDDVLGENFSDDGGRKSVVS